MLGSLAVSLMGDPKHLQKTFDDIDKKVGNMKKSMQDMGKKVSDVGVGLTKWVTGPIVAVGAGLLGLAAKTGDYADSILDLNAITGMSTDSIQEWQHVTKIAGVSTDAVTNASKALTKQFDQMREGTGKGSKALEYLKINFEDLENASPDERMDMLTKALQGVEDPTRRAELATQLFKVAGEDLLPILSMTEEAL